MQGLPPPFGLWWLPLPGPASPGTIMTGQHALALRRRTSGVRACGTESMPLAIDPEVLRTVQAVYNSELGLPDDWSDSRRAAFLNAEAEKITWMVRAQAGAIGDERVYQWTRQHGVPPDLELQRHLFGSARSEALRAVLRSELYELIDYGVDN